MHFTVRQHIVVGCFVFVTLGVSVDVEHAMRDVIESSRRTS
jgi:hypothetical protein